MRRTKAFTVVSMFATVVCLMIGLAPGTAEAQEAEYWEDAESLAQPCQAGGTAQWGPAIDIRVGTHILGDCNDFQARARAWFDGWPTYLSCSDGSAYVGGGKCEGTVNGQGEAIAHAAMPRGCGMWFGMGEHSVRHLPTNQILVNRTQGPLGPMMGPPCLRAEADEECQEWEIWDVQIQLCVAYNSPILVPLTHSQDYHLTSVDDGVMFDMDGDGVPERMAWTARNSRLAILAIDMDSDGRITSGRELVGDRMVEGKHNGFSALVALAPPETAKLTEEHELFQRLLLWEDRNHDGVSQPNELQPAGNVVSEIGLGFMTHNRRDRYGNKFLYQGWATVRTAPGANPSTSHDDMVERNIKLYDVFFKAQQ